MLSRKKRGEVFDTWQNFYTAYGYLSNAILELHLFFYAEGLIYTLKPEIQAAFLTQFGKVTDKLPDLKVKIEALARVLKDP